MDTIPDSCHVPWCSTIAMEVRGDRIIAHEGIDHCISDELHKLWEAGIETVCSCCGHGDDSRAFIRVKREYADRMLAMGYEPYEPHECLYHPGDPAYHAKDVTREREKGSPHDDRTVEEIREMWKRGVYHV